MFENEEYKVLMVFEGGWDGDDILTSYVIQEKETGRIALLAGCKLFDIDVMCEEDFDLCEQLAMNLI